MRAILFSILFFLQATFFVDPGWAASAHDEQSCAKSTIGIIGEFLQIDDVFKVPPDGNSPNENAIIVSAACKPHPINKQMTIAAIAYDSGTEYSMVVALVDKHRRKILSNTQSDIQQKEEAGTIEKNSLKIDTARYNLAPGIRAFGVDIWRHYYGSCGDGSLGPDRTLYVQGKNVLRPILYIDTMSAWRYLKGYDVGCGPDVTEENADSYEEIIEYINLAIELGASETKGFRDLIVTATSSRDDGKPTGKEKFRYRLRYDGQRYPTKQMQVALEKWDVWTHEPQSGAQPRSLRSLDAAR
jgi:hypothetical protein